jgi:hypothetical protein
MADGVAYELLRFRSRDGDETTVYLTRHPLATTRVSVVPFEEPRRLDHWCTAAGHPEAIVAGFFVRDPYPAARRGPDRRHAGRARAVGRAARVRSRRRRRTDRGPRRTRRRSRGRPRPGRPAARPRRPLGVSDDELLAVCCDGRRSGVDAGLELAELARLLISFGAREAINLDGGGSATLVHRGHLLNRPYSNHDQPAPESRPVVTALLLDPS